MAEQKLFQQGFTLAEGNDRALREGTAKLLVENADGATTKHGPGRRSVALSPR